MARAKHRNRGRDGVGFLALPHVVMDSPAFLNLSAPAVRLLLDIARQLGASNNGKLCASMTALKGRGWSSNDTLTRARRELEAAGFLFQTRVGALPNRAAWFALTWASLHWTPDMDCTESAFPRSAYLRGASVENARSTPSNGATGSRIAPGDGARALRLAPGDGAI